MILRNSKRVTRVQPHAAYRQAHCEAEGLRLPVPERDTTRDRQCIPPFQSIFELPLVDYNLYEEAARSGSSITDHLTRSAVRHYAM